MSTRHTLEAELRGRRLSVVGGQAWRSTTAVPGEAGRRPEPDDEASWTLIAELAGAMLGSVPDLADRLVAVIVSSDRDYARSSVLSFDDLWQSCHDNISRILEALVNRGRTRPELLDAPRLTGHRRAEQGFPLEHLLRAFRLGGNVVWEAVLERARADGDVDVDQLVQGAGHIWEMIDVFSGEVTDAYRRTEARLARRNDQHRQALIDALLEGAGHDRSLVKSAAAILDLSESSRCIVVVAEVPPNAPEALRRPADPLGLVGVRSAWRLRAERQIGILSIGSATVGDVTAALRPRAGSRVGISPIVEGLAHVDVAFRLADTAMRTIPPGRVDVVTLDGRPRSALVVESAEMAARLAGEVLGRVLALPRRDRDVLLQTLEAFLAADGSAVGASQQLYCHRNTVLNRLHRIETLTERSTSRPGDVTDLVVALDAVRLLGLAE